MQLAQELVAAGREVTLAVGEHVRMPRALAGKDIYWWLTQSGIFWEPPEAMDDLTRARRLPSPQLVGRPGADLNLNTLHAQGVHIVGRLVGVRANAAQFSGNLANLCKSADLKMRRLVERFNEWHGGGLAGDDLDVPPTTIPKAPLSAHLGTHGIKTVVWATGLCAKL